MGLKEAQTWVNDYLDLYQYARSIGDIEWQQEILAKLKNTQSEIESALPPQSYSHEDIWRIFDGINQEILSLYQQLRAQPSNPQLRGRILELKQHRQKLTRQISSVVKPHSS